MLSKITIEELNNFIDEEWRVIIPLSIAIISLIISIYLYYCNKRKHDLTIYLKGKTKITTEDLPFKHSTSQDIYRIAVKIKNTGTLPFEKKDFKKPIRINYGDNAKILDAKIIEKSQDLETKYSIYKNELIINKTFLNLEEFITFELLIDGYSEVHINSRISYIKKINYVIDTPESHDALYYSWGV